MRGPLVLALGEAQRFAPQARSSGSGEAVATLMRQGRKRGFLAVLATQRFSAVSKACLTQASSFLIGRVSCDTDVRLAEAELGFDRVQAQAQRKPGPRGRPREVEFREVINAVRYLVRSGCVAL